jgi:hypothetical protein
VSSVLQRVYNMKGTNETKGEFNHGWEWIFASPKSEIQNPNH